MKCIFCHNNNKFTKISEKTRDSSYSVVKCSKCDLIQLSPTPTVKEDQNYYRKGLHLTTIKEPTDLATLRKKQRLDTIRRADFVSKFLNKKSSVLDVGSGFGFFLEELIKRGYSSTGVEVSDFSRKISNRVIKARVLNVNILETDLKEKFDCITLFHVLEHITNPVEFLFKIKSLVTKKGKIVIEVPNADDLLLRSSEDYKKFYWQRPHISYFTPKTISKILKRANVNYYKIIFQHRYGLENMMNWMMNGKPQMKNPAYVSSGNYSWLESHYKKTLIEKGWADTMVIVITN